MLGTFNLVLRPPYKANITQSGTRDIHVYVGHPVRICAAALRVVCTKYYAPQLKFYAITCRQSR